MVEISKRVKHSHDIIVKYNDSILSTCRPNPPSDTASANRNEATIKKKTDGIINPTLGDTIELYDISNKARAEQYCYIWK